MISVILTQQSKKGREYRRGIVIVFSMFEDIQPASDFQQQNYLIYLTSDRLKSSSMLEISSRRAWDIRLGLITTKVLWLWFLLRQKEKKDNKSILETLKQKLLKSKLVEESFSLPPPPPATSSNLSLWRQPSQHLSYNWQLPQMEVYWLRRDWQVCFPTSVTMSAIVWWAAV